MIRACGLAAGLALAASAQPFPEGPGKAAFEAHCNFCHPASFVLDKAFSPKEWEELVGRMLEGQPATREQQTEIAAYLARNFPPKPDTKAVPQVVRGGVLSSEVPWTRRGRVGEP